MADSAEITKLDQIAKALTHGGRVRSLTISTPGGYVVEIAAEEYRRILGSGQNPITQIVSVTAAATSTSSASVPEGILDILRCLEDSGATVRELAEAKRELGTLQCELQKANPNEKVLRKVMRWALSFSLELFLRVAVLLSKHYLTQA